MEKSNRNKKFNESKKKLLEENANLKIELETTKKRLADVGNIINSILGESYYIIVKKDHPQAEPTGEMIKNYVENYLKGLENLKEAEKIHHPTDQERTKMEKRNHDLTKKECELNEDFIDGGKVNDKDNFVGELKKKQVEGKLKKEKTKQT